MAFLITLGYMLAIISIALLVCIIISWVNFNFQSLPDGYIKLSHKEFWELYKSNHKNHFEFDDDFFAARLYIKMDNRYRIKLNIIDYLYLQYKAKRNEIERKKEERKEANHRLMQELALEEQIAWFTDPKRIRQELDENGFTELKYVNRHFTEPKHVVPGWNDLHKNDVIYELKTQNYEITSFKLYVVTDVVDNCSLTIIPIERYNQLKKEKEENKDEQST